MATVGNDLSNVLQKKPAKLNKFRTRPFQRKGWKSLFLLLLNNRQ